MNFILHIPFFFIWSFKSSNDTLVESSTRHLEQNLFIYNTNSLKLFYYTFIYSVCVPSGGAARKTEVRHPLLQEHRHRRLRKGCHVGGAVLAGQAE